MKFNRAIAVLMVCCLLLLLPMNALAAGESIQKDENVFARLRANGSTDAVYVVNTFYPEQDGTFTDFGAYQKVSNLTSDKPLSINGDMVTFAVPAGRYSYQGDLVNVALPWNIRITYKCNGVPIEPDALAGKIGRISMRIQITDNPAGAKEFFEHYALQTTITLNAQTCSQITATGATIANAGSTKTITFTLMPGQTADYLVSFDTQSFEMDAVQFSGVPLSFDFDFDLSELTGGLSDLSFGIYRLYTGANQLSSGIRAYTNGIAQIAGYLSEVSNGLTATNSGYSQLYTGLSLIIGSLQQLNSGFSAYLANFDAAKTQLSSSLQTIANELSALKQAYAGYRSSVSNDPEDPQNPNHIAYTKETIQTMIQTNTALSAQLSVAAASEQNEATCTLLLQAAQALGDSAGALAYDAVLLNETETLLSGYSADNGTVIPALDTTLLALASGIDRAFDSLKQAGQSLSDGLTEIINGLILLSDGDGTAANPGLRGANAGHMILIQSLASLSHELNNVVKQSSVLNNGAEELANGLKRLKSGVSGIDTKAEAQIDKLLADFKGDFAAPSFVDERNTVSAVQFIFMTDPIRLAAEKDTSSNEPAQPIKSETAWDRFLALFR